MPGAWEHIEGSRSEHEIMFFGLSTCGWCRKTKEFLEESGVTFEYCSVDEVSKDEQPGVLETLTKHNPRRNFPTVVVDGSKVIVGYNPDLLKQELGL
ncbi:MAG: glutaredoxin family protein [Candidatus Eisenbacteria bacterium]